MSGRLRWRRLRTPLYNLAVLGARHEFHDYVVVQDPNRVEASYRSHITPGSRTRYIRRADGGPLRSVAEAQERCEEDLRRMLLARTGKAGDRA
jgi:hypothetical protein